MEPPPAPADDPSAAYAALLAEVVDERGLVDYDRLAADRAPLDAYVGWLGRPKGRSNDGDDRLADDLNAYNAFVLWGVLESGRPASVQDVPGRFFSKPGAGFFVERAYTLGYDHVSLWDLEHEGLVAAGPESAALVAKKPDRSSLEPLARALREAGGHSRFPPILLVAKDPLLTKLSVEAARCCETLRFYASVEEMHADLHCEQPEAILVPYEELAKLSEDDRATTVFAYGAGANDLRSRRHAASREVSGFLPDRIEFRPLLDRIRTLGHARRLRKAFAMVLLDDTVLRDRLVKALEARGIGASSLKRTEELVTSLRDASPDLLVMGAEVGGVPTPELIAAVRMAPRTSELTVVALAGPSEAAALVSGGCDGIVDPALSLEAVTAQIHAWLDRARSRSSGRDASTGVRDRASTLRELDRELSEARRGGKSLAVALIELDGLGDLLRKRGRGVGDQAIRLLARCLEGAIRASDLVGRLDEASFLVLLPGSSADQARRRLNDVKLLFVSLCARDDRLSSLTFSAGISGTEDGPEGLLARAEEVLERVRARDARGSIG